MMPHHCRAPWRAPILALLLAAGMASGVVSQAISAGSTTTKPVVDTSVPSSSRPFRTSAASAAATTAVNPAQRASGSVAGQTMTSQPSTSASSAARSGARVPDPSGVAPTPSAAVPSGSAVTSAGPIRAGAQAAAATTSSTPFVTSGVGRRAGVDSAVSASSPQPPVAGSWRMVYSDEFNGPDLDPRVWMKLRGLGQGYRWPYNVDIDASAFDPHYSTVENGALRIRWEPVPITDGGVDFPYTTGVATTATGFNFQYGVIEARIWVPRASGITPAFWLLPTPVDSTWPPEVDIAEFSTSGRGRVDAHFNVHYRQGSQLGQIPGFPTYGEDLGGSWHTYTLDWRPTSMTMLLDGREVYRYTGDGIPSTSMYILFSGGVQKGHQPGPGHMLVDYVRVWQ